MSKARIALAGVLAALFTVVGGTAAQAYPDPTIKITVGDARFVGGLPLEYEATSGGVECAWTVTFNGKTQTGAGTSLEGTFSTPKVDEITKKTITATCAYGGRAGRCGILVASDSATVTLLPEGDDDGDGTTDANGALPDTGGSNLWILIVGGVLIVVGGGAVVASRRQS